MTNEPDGPTGESKSRRSPAPRPPEPKSKARIHGAIARQLGIQIVSGVYQPGDLLDTEIAFSEQLNISRSAYREAVRILSAKGLVESRPKTGTRVSPRPNWHLLDPEVLAWFFESQPSNDFLSGLFELRMIVEPQAAALAAQRRVSQDLSRMRKALQDMARLTLADEAGRAADREFHDAVLDATRNPALFALSSSIGAAVRWTTIYKQRRRALPRDSMPDHWKVFDAIAIGDPDAARAAMQDLVKLALDDTRLSLSR
jgi:DNA-binding FadR family transcriptional regulator